MLDCRQCRDALSARWDGEQTGVPSAALDIHLGTCEPCRRFAARLHLLDAVPRDDVAAPDRSAAIMAAVRQRPAKEPPQVTQRLARGALAVVAVVGLLTVAVELSSGAEAHSLRDLGAFQSALAVGFLVAALRPATAAGLLPTAGALALCLLAVAVADVVGGRAVPERETMHATELIGVLLVWLIARDRPRRRVRHA